MNIDELKQNLSKSVDKILNTYKNKNVNEILKDLNEQKQKFEKYYNLTKDPVFVSVNAGKCNEIMDYLEKNSWNGGF